MEGAHGIGRALAQRPVGDGEQVLDVPAKLAARVRVLSVGHGRTSDADDAVAVAARSAPLLRQVGVENQAVVLHPLTKPRSSKPTPACRSCSASGRCWRPHSSARSATSAGSATKHHFAAHTGTAPLETSSGQVIRHRQSRAGDHKLNHALYMMAMVQVRRPSAGQAYYQRKLAEGKSPKEALRC